MCTGRTIVERERSGMCMEAIGSGTSRHMGHITHLPAERQIQTRINKPGLATICKISLRHAAASLPLEEVSELESSDATSTAVILTQIKILRSLRWIIDSVGTNQPVRLPYWRCIPLLPA